MSTLLTKQLKRLQSQRGFDGQTNASLIHDATSAGNLTADDCFQIGLEGYEALCEMDVRFKRYRSDLFTDLPDEREKNTKEEQLEIDDSISQFMRLLTDYFTETPAIKVLEHFIRNYKIHVFHVNDCMACGLIYHSTIEFQRLLNLMDLKETMWHWLQDLQKAQLPFHRDVIVQRCLIDRATLSFICEMAKWSAEERYHNRRVYPFFAVVLCEVLEKMQEVTEETVRVLMSVTAAGLNAEAPDDFRRAIHLIFIQLCRKASISENALSALLQSLLERSRATETSQLIIVINRMYQTQMHYKHIPEKALKLLLGVEGFSSHLGCLVQRGLDAQRFLRLLLKKLVKEVAKNSNSAALDFLSNLISDICLEKHVAETITRIFSLPPISPIASLRSIVHALDIRYPLLVDQSVNIYLQNTEDEERVAWILSLVHGSENEAIHASVDGTRMTLLAAADAPAREIRRAAMKRLSMLTTAEQSDFVISFLKTLYLRRLEDDVFEVAAETMLCDLSILEVGARVIRVMRSLLSTAMERTQNNDSLARTTAVRIAQYLTAVSGVCTPDDICFLLMEHVFPLYEEQVPVCYDIGCTMNALQHPLAQILSEGMRTIFSKNEHTSPEQTNRSLAKRLVCIEADLIATLFEKCTNRCRCIISAAIEPSLVTEMSDSIRFTLVKCIVGKLPRFTVDESPDTVQMTATVQFTSDLQLHYSDTLIDALTILYGSVGYSPTSSGFNNDSIEENLIVVLQQSQCSDLRLQRCIREMLTAGNSQERFSFVLHFICHPRHDCHTAVVLKGLSTFRSLLRKGVEMDMELGDCTIALCTLLCHSKASIRKASFKITQKLTSFGSPSITDLFQYFKEHETSIRTDRDALIRIFSDLFKDCQGREGHVAKKQKNIKEQMLTSGVATELMLLFRQQLAHLSLEKQPRQLSMTIRCLSGAHDDAQLILSSVSLLERALLASDLSEDAADIAVQIISLYRIRAIVSLSETDAGQRAMQIFLSCLKLSSHISIKRAALRLMKIKWTKAIRNTQWNDIFMDVLHLANKDPVPEIALEAAAVAAKWPLKEKDITAYLKQFLDSESTLFINGSVRSCLWLLELLLNKENVIEYVSIADPLQQILRTVIDMNCDSEEEQESILPLCRAAFALLETLFKTANPLDCPIVEMELIVAYLSQSSDPVLRESILTLLRSMSASADSILAVRRKVLKIVSEQTKQQMNKTAHRQSMEAITAIITGWAQDKESIHNTWSTLTTVLTTMEELQRHVLLEAVLNGFARNTAEGLSMGITSLLSDGWIEEEEIGKTIASELLHLATWTERNRALALALCHITERYSNVQHNAITLLKVLALTLTTLKASAEYLSTIPSQMQSGGGESFSGLSEILSAVVRIKISITDFQGTGDGQLMEVAKYLHQILSVLRNLMHPTSYLLTLSANLENCDIVFLETLLPLMERRLHEINQRDEYQDVNLSTDLCALCPQLIAILKIQPPSSHTIVHLILATIQHLAHIFATQQSNVFDLMIPTVVEYTKSMNREIRGGALACMAALLSEMDKPVISLLPEIMPSTLQSMDLCIAGIDAREMEEEGAFLDLASGLLVIESMLTTLGEYTSPYLDRLLSLILHPALPSVGVVSELLVSVRELLTQRVPTRLLLPEVVRKYESISKADYTSVCHHMSFVQEMAKRMSNAIAAQFLQEMSGFFLSVFEIRQMEQLNAVDVLAVERSAIAAFLQYVMKLNEKQFKPLIDALLDWMFRPSATVAQQTTGFHVLSELTSRLKTLFIGYVPTFLDNATRLISEEIERKPWTDTHRNTAHFNMYTLRCFIVNCLRIALEYDDENILHEELTEKIIAGAVTLLRRSNKPSVGFLEELGTVLSGDLNFTGSDFCDNDALSKGVVGLLIQLGREGTLQKRVNHKVLRCCTRSRSSYIQSLSLCVVRSIVSEFKEDFAPLIPESIPLLAEVMEIGDGMPPSIAREIINLFEQITGEDFEQHIQQN